ncbi:cobalt-precorrin-6A reductase [Enhydrobacter sp.]|jgi:precorrin-6A/cobalt-precorrin-6A reductase|uniref:cobalt-precorrin-6A reductase n=1 Tax=Enhydrobacter sp. TaxID=1894999 RepID=UPI00261E1509|nr:cobalt-precorrin-6A reductase [Enhydrobacter sp.]WIM10305.1 MAG: Precorrin-6A reductase [Enhydrobacter sp.]
MATALRILILGGTTEASALARLLAGDARFEATLSLAGRTSTPKPQPIATRIGGFGGVDGLVHFLRGQAIEAVIDATHPYADQMSAHAVAACSRAGVTLASLVRTPWTRHAGDRWQAVSTATAAALALGSRPSRVFLGLGRQELAAFAAAPQHHYLARVIEPPSPAGLPPDLRILQARGPFDRDAEERLLKNERIEILVSKNAGGTATYAKIEAARALGLPVIMIERPHKPRGHIVGSAAEAVAWLERHFHDAASRSLRGV